MYFLVAGGDWSLGCPAHGSEGEIPGGRVPPAIHDARHHLIRSRSTSCINLSSRTHPPSLPIYHRHTLHLPRLLHRPNSYRHKKRGPPQRMAAKIRLQRHHPSCHSLLLLQKHAQKQLRPTRIHSLSHWGIMVTRQRRFCRSNKRAPRQTPRGGRG